MSEQEARREAAERNRLHGPGHKAVPFSPTLWAVLYTPRSKKRRSAVTS